jgi:hypothetical protein
MKTRRTAVLERATLIMVLACGCAENLGTETPSIRAIPAGSAGSVERDCVVSMPAYITAWSTPATIAYPDGALWIFPSVTLSNGSVVPGAAAWFASADAVCAGTAEWLTNPDGSLAALLALSPAESSANANRGDGRSLMLMPRTGVSEAGASVLFYEHMLVGPSSFDFEALGTGVCTIDRAAGTCTRAVDALGSTVLWLGREFPVRSAFADAGTTYVLACRAPAALMQSCTLARVATSSAGTPSAYSYFDAFAGWQPSRASATQVLDDLAIPSLSFNPYQGRFTVVLLDPFVGKVSLRTAAAPDQEFTAPVPLFSTAPPAPGTFIDGGAEQTAFRGENGRVIHIMYTADSGGGREVHLLSYRFAKVLP